MGNWCSSEAERFAAQDVDEQYEKPVRKLKKKQVTRMKSLEFNPGLWVKKNEGDIGDEYKVIQTLGEGGFGRVVLAEHKKTGAKRAIKIIDRSSMDETEHEKIRDELEILKLLSHPNIICVYEYFEEPDFLYIVTELWNGGELLDYFLDKGQLYEDETAQIIYQVLSATVYWHSRNVVHRDLKPENLLIRDSDFEGAPDVKVIDFGLAVLQSEDQKMQNKRGSCLYIAPEVIQKNYDEKWDVWSIGVIWYILLWGHPPFDGKTEVKTFNSILNDPISLDGEEWNHVSDDAKDFILKLLQKDPSKRLSAQEAIEHEWIFGNISLTPNRPSVFCRSLDRLKQFTAGMKLKQAIIGYITHQLMTQEEVDQLRNTFISLDTNGDGELSHEEIVRGYKKLHQHVDVTSIMEQVDANMSGSIGFNEFLAATSEKEKLLSQSNLKWVFNKFDRDGNGTISALELKETIGEDHIKDSVWLDLLSEVDNHTGEIDLKTFCNMLLKA